MSIYSFIRELKNLWRWWFERSLPSTEDADFRIRKIKKLLRFSFSRMLLELSESDPLLIYYWICLSYLPLTIVCFFKPVVLYGLWNSLKDHFNNHLMNRKGLFGRYDIILALEQNKIFYKALNGFFMIVPRDFLHPGRHSKSCLGMTWSYKSQFIVYVLILPSCERRHFSVYCFVFPDQIDIVIRAMYFISDVLIHIPMSLIY